MVVVFLCVFCSVVGVSHSGEHVFAAGGELLPSWVFERDADVM